MSTLSVATLKSKAALTPPLVQDSAGVEIGQFARAWVNFNGSGTVAIRAAFNVSSITDNGVGDYTVNFANAMPDANYAVLATTTASGYSGVNAIGVIAEALSASNTFQGRGTAGCRLLTSDNNADTAIDSFSTSVAVYR